MASGLPATDTSAAYLAMTVFHMAASMCEERSSASAHKPHPIACSQASSRRPASSSAYGATRPRVAHERASSSSRDRRAASPRLQLARGAGARRLRLSGRRRVRARSAASRRRRRLREGGEQLARRCVAAAAVEYAVVLDEQVEQPPQQPRAAVRSFELSRPRGGVVEEPAAARGVRRLGGEEGET